MDNASRLAELVVEQVIRILETRYGITPRSRSGGLAVSEAEPVIGLGVRAIDAPMIRQKTNDGVLGFGYSGEDDSFYIRYYENSQIGDPNITPAHEWKFNCSNGKFSSSGGMP